MLEQTLNPARISRSGAAEAVPSFDPPVATPFDDLESIVALYEPRIFRFLLTSLRDRDLALSLTQDTFLRAWTARASFRGDSSINTWLMRIALNLLRDHTRTNRFRFWKKAAASVRSSSPASSKASRSPTSPRSPVCPSVPSKAISPAHSAPFGPATAEP